MVRNLVQKGMRGELLHEEIVKAMGKFSRRKGVTGELSVAHLVGGKRTGYAGTNNPDITTVFAVYSVKNHAAPISLKKVLSELKLLQQQDNQRHHFVAIKVEHKWLVVETMEQHQDDHVGGKP